MILSDRMGLNCFPPSEFKSREVIVIEEKAVRTHFQFATSLDILHCQSYRLMLTYWDVGRLQGHSGYSSVTPYLARHGSAKARRARLHNPIQRLERMSLRGS